MLLCDCLYVACFSVCVCFAVAGVLVLWCILFGCSEWLLGETKERPLLNFWSLDMAWVPPIYGSL